MVKVDRNTVYSRFRSVLESAGNAAEASDALCLISSHLVSRHDSSDSQQVVAQVAEDVLSESHPFANADAWKRQSILFWDDFFSFVDVQIQARAASQIAAFASGTDASEAIRGLAIRVACGLSIDGFPSALEQIRVSCRKSRATEAAVSEYAANLKWSLPRYYEVYFEKPAPWFARGVALVRAFAFVSRTSSKS